MRRSTTIGRHAENGTKLYKARRLAGLSQMKVCELAGVSHRQYVRLENGEHLPSARTRDALCDALGVDRGEIASGDDEEEAELPADLDRALHILARYVAARATV